MAFESLTGPQITSTGKLEVGESLEGYLNGVVVEKNKFGGQSCNLLFADKSGMETKVLTNGTAKYFAQNIAQALGHLPKEEAHKDFVERDSKAIGCKIRITKTGTYTNKQGKEVTKYDIAVDSSDKLIP